MKITICTSGRFHVADLARELIRLGHEVSFHSIVPPRRLEAFGIPRANQVCHLAAVAPLVAARRLNWLPGALKRKAKLRMQRLLDARFSRIREPGDVLIGMSGLCVEVLRSAKQRGAIVLVERGSRHILSQKRILDALAPGEPTSVPEWAVKRELQGYELADRVVVGSKHAVESFVDEGYRETGLFRNAYGVDLDDFSPTTLHPEPFDVIMVGRWGRQKGCDLLSEVVLRKLGKSLLHVGPVDDLPLPADKGFQHLDSVPQRELPQYYARARVFAMPSRQDGFGMVYAQALASGLPIVGSTRSGAEDLGELLGLNSPWVQAVPPDDPVALGTAIEQALYASEAQQGPRELLGPTKDRMSWRAYGERYERWLNTLGCPRAKSETTLAVCNFLNSTPKNPS